MTREAGRRLALIGAFEGSLFLVAALLAQLTNVPLLSRFHSTVSGWAVALGLAGVGFIAFQFTYRSSYAPLRKIRFFLDERARPLFFGLGPLGLLTVSALAGLGEEALFRGWLQSWLENFVSLPLSCLLAGIVFGAAHSITRGYAVCTAIIGVALGALQVHSGGWLAPAFAHALYDFVALSWYLHRNH